jgi:glucosamine kinase
MIAIAESGSTKCDWIVLNRKAEVVLEARTPGFNPYFHGEEFVLNSLHNCSDLAAVKDKISTIFFYGAGCSSEALNLIIQEALAQFFVKAKITVDHDLVAAAYSLYEGEPIISCIVGTGSNSCFFDGDKVHELVPALGFILGDEASGSYFGKKILADYFYKRLPAEMQRDFDERYNLDWSQTVENVYKNAHANVYLASFMPFIIAHRENPYVIEMVKDGMARFIDVHIANFSNYHQHKVGFVGTLAFLFEDILKEELLKRDCKPGRIIKNPADNLVQYHREFKSEIFTELNPVELNSK